MAANRYSTKLDAPHTGVTLIFAHANGTPKEYWEPVLYNLLGPTQSGTNSSAVQIREAWAFDALDHGDSAIANYAALKEMKDGVSIVEWARAIAAFVEAHLMSHQIVLVGQSVGNVAIVYSMLCFSPSTARVPYEGMILVEPPMHDRQLRDEHYEDRIGHIELLTKAVTKQRVEYRSRKEAYDWMSTHSPWKVWDDRVRKLFVDKGLRLVDQDNPNGAVTSKCHRPHEIAKFYEWEPMFVAVDHITDTCGWFQYHFIFGAINDAVPRYVQDNIVSAERGRKVASVTRISGTGHMVVQQKPDAVANVIREILKNMAAARVKPRL